jgi:tRNA threonylcarbamoyladenosine biosynthesis protein TsaB
VRTLAIDASTYGGTVALSDGPRLIAEREAPIRGGRSEQLMPMVAAAMSQAGVSPRALERIVCGAGPGSFTSLRIAASIAKGLASGARCPLYAVPSALFIVAGARPRLPSGRYLTAIDALRGQWFASLVEVSDSTIAPAGVDMLVPRDALAGLARELGAEIAGPGMAHDLPPHARGVVGLERVLAESAPVDLSTWEPNYGRAAEAQARWETAHGRPLPRV